MLEFNMCPGCSKKMHELRTVCEQCYQNELRYLEETTIQEDDEQATGEGLQ